MERPHYHGHRQRLRERFLKSGVAYCTRKERRLPLASDRHTYDRAGAYRLPVKVVDIFGNDTPQAFDLEIR